MSGPRAPLSERLALRALRALDPERAHGLAVLALKAGLGPVAPAPDPILATRLFGAEFASPVGLAAGFDKGAEAPGAMLRAGFGFVEVGAATPLPQRGNPRPRLFRLDEDRAAINRFGFNSEGLETVAARLRRFAGDRSRLWANLGANRTSEDRAADYVTGMRGLHGLVGAMTLNVSSPNTERLRDLQGPAALRALLDRAAEAREALGAPRFALLLKIAPDLTDAELAAVAAAAMEAGLDGIVATNTTTAREGLRSRHAAEPGGLSGAPLKAKALHALRRLRLETGGAIPLVGVGGVATAEDAFERLRAGASAVQLYTALVFEGPGLAARIATGLADRLRREGFASVAAVVGTEPAETP